MKTTIEIYTAEARKAVAGLHIHFKDPDPREVIGRIVMVIDGIRYTRRIREPDGVCLESLQQEVYAIHRSRGMKP